MTYRISVDTGGTFTDVVVAHAGGVVIGKALTTHDRIFRGVAAAIAIAAEQLETTADALLRATSVFIYGTTRAINAVVTKKTARTAFLTTEGFPDILLFREGGKTNPSDFSQNFPEPYIPRRHTFEIAERVSADGSVFTPLDEAQARATLTRLREQAFEAVAVSLIWSISNPVHELRLGELIEEILPGVPYTLSHQLLPIMREYRRASATVIDASLKPLMQRHFREMELDLREAGYAGELLISTSIGGSMSVAEVAERPIHALKSGPAMAPVAALSYARSETLNRNIIVADTGGTTFDVGLVRDGELVHTRDTWLGGRFVGELISMSAVDVRSIGAGGGSIAWIDGGGLLRVGPQSAGSVPGPASYGLGGEQPTVTDAAVVLGYIDPEFFVGGRLTLDVAAAERVIGALAERLGRPAQDAAFAVLQVANEMMIKAIGELTVSEGLNPAESLLVAGGGAAGLNILPIARELGCAAVLAPKTASALSAYGMQVSDISTEHSGTLLTRARRFDLAGVAATLTRIDDELDRFVSALPGVRPEQVRKSYFVEARYQSQVWELETELPSRTIAGAEDVAALAEAFHATHERVYAVRDPGSDVEFVNWKGRVAVKVAPEPTPLDAAPPSGPAAATRFRSAFFGGAGPERTPVHRGSEIRPGETVAGPAIIEEPTTTIVVYPGWTARVSAAGHFIIETV
ncbi:hydantoinase/oxoprolinase family protein [Methylopila musalis]|uniref:Hydantoinase/oxoprolinase family protein n=1 Tax=Methylopila musalis TaxID=1134781 RepID=A0ABW3ZA11_9HYPH